MSNLLVIVDRVEGAFAVLEFPDRRTKDVPIDQLPTDVKAGDCFWFEQEKYTPAPEEAEKRRVEITKLAHSMWKD